ncbi:MAG: histidine kinase [Gammaproteobacteria bacterium]
MAARPYRVKRAPAGGMTLGEERGGAEDAAEAGWPTRAVLPPSFCRPRALLEVAGVSVLATGLVLIGRSAGLGAGPVLPLLFYGAALGVFCALGVCIARAPLARLATRNAWLSAWVVVLLFALAFSYGCGVIGTVLGFGPGRSGLGAFMLESMLAAGIVAAGVFRYRFIRGQWEAELSAEAEARVQALQARIRPHFLFNSLNTIASLIHDEPDSAERATEDLADLFRAGMRRADRLIPVADELALARKYLDMEQRRLGERLRVEWDTDSLPSSARVLPMLLQPLLENAVGHGIQPRPDGGLVRVFGRREGPALVLTVSNPLAPPGDHRGSGMALANIRSRIALAHGDRASLVTDRDEHSFYAVLTLPHAEDTDRR